MTIQPQQDTNCLGDVQTATQQPRPESHDHQEEFCLLEVIVDSGACDHVDPPRILPSLPIRETEASKRDLHYFAVNGGKVPNIHPPAESNFSFTYPRQKGE